MKTIWNILRTFIPRRNNPYVGLLAWMVFLVLTTAAVQHKGASKVTVKIQPVSIAPPKIKSLTTAKGIKARRPVIPPENMLPPNDIIPMTWRTNLYWDAQPGMEFEIIETTNLVDWRSIGVTTNNFFPLGPVQVNLPLRLFRVGAREIIPVEER